MDIPTIHTARLTLRAFTDQDVDPLHGLLGEREVLRYFPSTEPPARDRVERLVAGQLKHWQEHGYGWWAVALQRQEGLIGWAGLQFLPETEEVEVAYLLGKPFWGKGYATEAARASLRFGFEDLELPCIVAIVHPENAASQRVVEKLGMPFTERTCYFGMDCYRYALARPAYAARV